MRTRYKILDEAYPYFVTATIVEWIPVFTKERYFEIITSALKFCREKEKFKLHAFVILDNHLHLIISGENLSQGIKDFKSFTARKIIETAKADNQKWLLNQFAFFKKKHKTESEFQVWQEGVHPQMIQNEAMLTQKAEYIHENPVKRGLVKNPEHWIYSSASNYILESGVLEIDFFD